MRSLRYILRLVFALEALGFLSLAILTLRQSTLVEQRLHLGPVAIVEVSWFIILLALVSAIAALRLKGQDALGRWSLLAASIFNLMLFPFGVVVAAGGILLLHPQSRSPAQGRDQTPADRGRWHQPMVRNHFHHGPGGVGRFRT